MIRVEPSLSPEADVQSGENPGRRLRVGFVGLGSQGGPMARRMVDAGFPSTLWARRPDSLAPFAATPAVVAADKRELGARSDVVGVCVVSDADVDEVLLGEDGVLAGMSAGGVVLIHSTVHPDTCRRLAADFPHLDFLDAPVSGGGHKAAAGELLVLVGGDAGVLERCRPVLETFADPIVHLGPLGTGQEAKLLNNALFTAHLGLAAAAFSIAESRGLDPRALASALAAGSGRSYGAELLAGTGTDLHGFGALAGGLLAKDVGILAELLGSRDSTLIRTADVALTAMGRPSRP